MTFLSFGFDVCCPVDHIHFSNCVDRNIVSSSKVSFICIIIKSKTWEGKLTLYTESQQFVDPRVYKLNKYRSRLNIIENQLLKS